MSAKDVHSQERAVLAAVLLAELILLVLLTLASYQLSRSLSRPIITLARATEQVAAGDLTTRAEVKGSHEIEILGRSFNAMTDALRAGKARMEELSNTDFLTGLRNHRYFQERLAEELSRADRYHRYLSVIMIDVDHFRNINAEHGHQGGDDLLQQLGELLRARARDSDVVTRYGGEEFAVILPETDGEEAAWVADRLRQAVEDHVFTVRSREGRAEAKRTISAGVASFPIDSGESDGLVVAADVALYRAKYLSRNRVCKFSDQQDFPVPHLDPAELHRALQDASGSAVESLAQALEARDRYTRGHSENVTRISLAIAAALGMSEEAQAQLRIAGMLHDIGKIGVPDAVLNKRGALSSEEWELIRAHPSIGASILAKSPLLEEVIPIVLRHHERYDGSGYPTSSSAADIPLASRILAVADSYDAMTSDRPYRGAMSREEATAELRANAGKQFDPEIVEAFVRLAEEAVSHPAEPPAEEVLA